MILTQSQEGATGITPILLMSTWRPRVTPLVGGRAGIRSRVQPGSGSVCSGPTRGCLPARPPVGQLCPARLCAPSSSGMGFLPTPPRPTPPHPPLRPTTASMRFSEEGWVLGIRGGSAPRAKHRAPGARACAAEGDPARSWVRTPQGLHRGGAPSLRWSESF